jgi:hypothetical protein
MVNKTESKVSIESFVEEIKKLKVDPTLLVYPINTENKSDNITTVSTSKKNK